MSHLNWRKLRDDIQSTTSNFDNIFIMTSGGVDSVFLCDTILRNTTIKPTIIHFQHHIRTDDHQEVELVSKLAVDNDLPCLVGHGKDLRDVKNQEQEARNQRWGFVESEIAKLSGSTIVLTAHHFSDNIESFLMNSIRGRSIDCLVMKKLTSFPNYTRYKPLLDFTKDEIYKLATRRRLNWIEDITNNSEDLSCERNFWRNVIIKNIREIRNIDKSMRGLINELAAMG